MFRRLINSTKKKSFLGSDWCKKFTTRSTITFLNLIKGITIGMGILNNELMLLVFYFPQLCHIFVQSLTYFLTRLPHGLEYSQVGPPWCWWCAQKGQFILAGFLVGNQRRRNSNNGRTSAAGTARSRKTIFGSPNLSQPLDFPLEHYTTHQRASQDERRSTSSKNSSNSSSKRTQCSSVYLSYNMRVRAKGMASAGGARWW